MATIPVILLNGTTADANDVMADLTELYTNIDENNVASGNKTGSGRFVLQTSPTINGLTITNPVISGIVTGTYTLAGTPTLSGTFAGNPNFSGNVSFDTNTLFINSTTHRVGVGTITPQYSFQVGDTGATMSLGGAPTGNSSGILNFINSNSVTNWAISSNNIVPGAFCFIPSTVPGGSTFTTPLLSMTSGGMAIGGTTVSRKFNLYATSADEQVIGISAATSTGAVRQFFINSTNTRYFEIDAFFSSGTELLLFQSDITTNLGISRNGGVGLGASGKLYFDGVSCTGDTYIHESATNVLGVVVGGSTALEITGTTLAYFQNIGLAVTTGENFYLDGGTNDYITSPSNGVINIVAAATTALQITSGGLQSPTIVSPTITSPTITGLTLSGTISGSPTFSGSITFSNPIALPNSSTAATHTASSRSQAKGWVKFDVALGVVTVRESFNLSSVTRTVAGAYTINWSNSFSSNDFLVVGNSSLLTPIMISCQNGSNSSTSVRCYDAAGTLVDTFCSIVCFGNEP